MNKQETTRLSARLRKIEVALEQEEQRRLQGEETHQRMPPKELRELEEEKFQALAEKMSHLYQWPNDSNIVHVTNAMQAYQKAWQNGRAPGVR